MDMWNEKLTRENFSNFYYSTVEMVYPSVFGICKETTRSESAIIKSYLEVYQQRNTLKGEDVIYVFGDILLKNAQETAENHPLPPNVSFAPRNLDEYTRNFMLEKILVKIDSAGYKVAEFMSSDSKKSKSTKSLQRVMNLFPITPLLIIQLILLALVIWFVSNTSITFPYRNDPLVNEQGIYEGVELENKYVTMLPYYPLGVRYPVQQIDPATELGEDYVAPDSSEIADNGLSPSLAETTQPEPSATRG